MIKGVQNLMIKTHGVPWRVLALGGPVWSRWDCGHPLNPYLRNTMQLFTFFLIYFAPGTPGAPWTDEEMLHTKAKIRWVIKNPLDALKNVTGGPEALAFYQAQTQNVKLDAIKPSIGKLVRLTFHDCINEVSGAGCNGCLNFEGMGNFYWPQCAKQGDCKSKYNSTRPANGPFKTDNNNLLWMAQVLEKVYHDTSLGLAQSLYESGKSRADLWAFAGLVAIQKATENHNQGCRSEGPFPCKNQINEESPRCDFELPEPTFKTGRSDCVSSCTGDNAYPFCTTNEEIHPNPNGNGSETVEFFKDNFGFNPKQAAALMGAHTLGHANEANSMFRHYPWTRQGQHHLNNMYFVNIVNSTGYRHRSPAEVLKSKGQKMSRCGLNISFYIGDEYGDPSPLGYKVRSERRTSTHGPWSWSLHQRKCNAAVCQHLLNAGEPFHMNSCCNRVEYCANSNANKCKNEVCLGDLDTGDDSDCTKIDHFISTSMMSPDVGLYHKFSTDEDGRPFGCPGTNIRKTILLTVFIISHLVVFKGMNVYQINFTLVTR